MSDASKKELHDIAGVLRVAESLLPAVFATAAPATNFDSIARKAINLAQDFRRASVAYEVAYAQWLAGEEPERDPDTVISLEHIPRFLEIAEIEDSNP